MKGVGKGEPSVHALSGADRVYKLLLQQAALRLKTNCSDAHRLRLSMEKSALST